jgi:hypothetical protein
MEKYPYNIHHYERKEIRQISVALQYKLPPNYSNSVVSFGFKFYRPYIII